MDTNSTFFAVFGSISIFIVLLQIVRYVFPWIYRNFLGPKLFGPRVDVCRLGEWAVVTGATDGIGKAYAKALAKKGLKLVLISRSTEKLEAVAKEIRDASNVEVKILQIDFTGNVNIYDTIKSFLEGIEIGVLVNNVGISYPHPEYFLESYEKKPQFLLDIVNVNIHSVLHMTALILPGMVERQKGAIINISSMAGAIPNPLLSVYAATKAFVNKFSEDLQTEYESKGIIFQSIQPGFVATNMTKIKKTTMMAPSADCYVASSLRTLGIANQTCGYFPHCVMKVGISAVGCVMGLSHARKMVLENLLATRKRALRNLEKENKEQ